MKINALTVCVHHGLRQATRRPHFRCRYQWRPAWLPVWAWNRRPVRWLLMRMRRRG